MRGVQVLYCIMRDNYDKYIMCVYIVKQSCPFSKVK